MQRSNLTRSDTTTAHQPVQRRQRHRRRILVLGARAAMYWPSQGDRASSVDGRRSHPRRRRRHRHRHRHLRAQGLDTRRPRTIATTRTTPSG